MKEGKTLQELAVELEWQRSKMRDFKAPTSKLYYNTDGRFDLLGPDGISRTDQTFVTNDLFMRQLTSWAKIPSTYVDRMRAEAPTLLAQNINIWLTQQKETRLVRTLDGLARAFLSHRYRVIDNIDVLTSVMPVFQERGIATVSQDVTDGHLYIKALNQRRTFEVRKGEKVQFGVVVSNSEVGLGAVHVDPLVFTLTCLNGAVIADAGLRKFHIGRRLQELDESMEVFKDDTVVADNKAFFLKLRDVVNAAFDEAQMTEVIQAAEAGTKRKLGDRPIEQVIEVTCKNYGLTEAEGSGVLRRLIEDGDLTQWGLAGAVTAYSQQVESYERATELERVGGTIMMLPESEFAELAEAA